MRSPWSAAVLSIALLAEGSVATAQEITLGGQVRPRLEYRDSLNLGSGSFTSMRVRAQLAAELDRGVSVFIQFQDVRLWGEESSTLTDFSSDHLDLHQGYLQIQSGGPTTLAAQVGRQELLYGGQRLIGPVDWAQQGRAFDALRLGVDGEAFAVDLFVAQLAESSAQIFDDDSYLLGTYGVLQRVGPGALDLYVLYNEADGVAATNQVTTGARWRGDYHGFPFRGEATYQTGERAGSDVAAFMLAGRVGAPLFNGLATLVLWYDYLSGSDDPGTGTVRAFDTLFATNHKFYGLADYFLNIPVQTAGRGLQDFALKTAYLPHDAVTLALDLHSFHLARSGGLSTGHLGEEADFTGAYRYSKHLRVAAGLSYLFAAEGFAEIGRVAEDAVWAFLMLDAAF